MVELDVLFDAQKVLWIFLWRETLYASLIFIGVAVILKSKRLRAPTIRYGLWSLVFLRLVLPPGLNADWSLSALLGRVGPVLPSAINQVGTGDAAHPPLEVSMATVETLTLNPWLLLGLTILTLAWVVGVVWRVSRFYRERRIFVGYLRDSHEVSDPVLLGVVQKWRDLYRVRRKVRLVHGQHQVSPFTMGCRRPVVFIPSGLIGQPRQYQETVIAHELAHVRRLDDGWVQLYAVIRALYFFNPLIGKCMRECQHERERMCDHLVIQRGELSPKSYGQGLLAILRLQLGSTQVLPALSQGGRRLETRLRSLPSYRQPRGWSFWQVPGLLALALFILPMATSQTSTTALPDRPITSTDVWRHPLPNGRLTSAFGMRWNPFSKQRAHHKGIDLAAPLGTPIFAPAAGLVLQATADYEGGERYGTVVLLDHGNGVTSLFSHLQSLAVKPGQRVTQGETIGTLGKTGKVTAPHVHFEVWKDGEPVDPQNYLPGATTKE